MSMVNRLGECLAAGLLAASMAACGSTSGSTTSISCQFQAGTAFVAVTAGPTRVNLGNVRVEVYDANGQPLQGFTPIFQDSEQHTMTYLHAGRSVIGYANAPLNDGRSCKAAII
jgi:hypothetical protein